MKTEAAVAAVKNQLNDKWQAVQERVSDTARDVSRTTNDYVRENPWRLLAIATLAGLVIGFLLGNRDQD